MLSTGSPSRRSRSFRIHGALVSIRDSKIRPSRYGVVIICSRKVDKRSTRRNLLRRRVREIVRKDLKGHLGGRPLAIEIQPKARDASYDELRNDILNVFHIL